jgi:hypothetical protein
VEITSQLQKLFAQIKSGQSCSVLQLINSFNWPAEYIHSQSDVHDFHPEFLCDLSRDISIHGGDNSFLNTFMVN